MIIETRLLTVECKCNSFVVSMLRFFLEFCWAARGSKIDGSYAIMPSPNLKETEGLGAIFSVIVKSR